MSKHPAAAACIAALLTTCIANNATAQTAAAQSSTTHADLYAADACAANAAPIAGIVRDTTGATVAEAAVTLDTGESTQTGADGRFHFRCIASSARSLHITAESFAPLDSNLPRNRADVTIVLHPGSVEQNVEVSANDSARGVDNKETGSARTLSGSAIDQLADDPDDLKRQLQQLTLGSGGSPETGMITVDGFQNTSALPPKASIAYIRVNPDLFSAEYQEPPYTGGRVEIYTKPGATRYHGALFTTYGGSFLNAQDPFSTSKGKLGKQRYGAELNGPIRKQGSDFALALEHRAIDNLAVVHAVQLDSNGNQVNVDQNVAAPQSLWESSARVGWQLGPKNTFSTSFTDNDSQLSNVGVGGTTLAESGYDNHTYDRTLRLINITTASPTFTHEGRISFRWLGNLQFPHSTAPQVQVAGAFTGGGAETGAVQEREFGIEILDDAIWIKGRHTMKFGTNIRTYSENNQETKDFNGVYTFGGGAAPVLDTNGNAIPGQTTIITGLEQYRRAQRGLPGGAATAYQVVTGTPQINYTQTRVSFFAQDEWKIKPNLLVSYGARYYAQSSPKVSFNLVPRVGIAWSPDKKQLWTIKLHSGLFNGRYGTDDATELRRLDGINRHMSTIYSPNFNNPFLNATPIGTVRTTAPNFDNVWFSEQQIEIDRTLPGAWNVQGTFYWIRGWNFARTNNINSPLNNQPTGPRPITPNLNILQAQNSGSMKGDIEFVSVSQQKNKYLNIFFGYARVDLRDDVNDDTFFNPQSSTTDAGEYARRTYGDQHQVFGGGVIHIPGKVDLSSEYYAGSGRPFNITTGFDNNGDGNFNDRPRYAQPGDANVVQTRYGLLTSTGGTGTVPRNTGTMPFTVHMDLNLSRSFVLTPHAAKDSLQTLALNIRAANALNHTNVKQVGGVLGSPLFGLPYQADTGRRVEIGARYNF